SLLDIPASGSVIVGQSLDLGHSSLVTVAGSLSCASELRLWTTTMLIASGSAEVHAGKRMGGTQSAIIRVTGSAVKLLGAVHLFGSTEFIVEAGASSRETSSRSIGAGCGSWAL